MDSPGIKSWWGQDLPHPYSILYNGYWVSVQGVKHPGCGIDHPPSTSAVVKEKVELYRCSPLWTFMAYSRMNFTFDL